MSTVDEAIKFPWVDYRHHPAYQDQQFYEYDDVAIEQSIEAANRLFLDIKKEIKCSLQLPKEKFQQLSIILDQLYLLIEKTVGASHPLCAVLLDAIAGAKQDLRQQLKVALEARRYRSSQGLTNQAKKIINDLQDEGISFYKISQQKIDKLFNLTARQRKVLEERMNADVLAPAVYAYAPGTKVYRFVISVLKEAGLLSALSEYKRGRAKPRYIALSYSSDKEQWWQNAYCEYGIPTAKTAYLHADRDSDIMKAIIYLGKVGKENGPFHCIPGSHFWQRNEVQMSLIKSFEDVFMNRFRDPCSHYRRSALLSEQGKKVFSALPPALQMLSHFGEDVLDESTLSTFLLKKEKIVLSEEANFFVFEGAKILHRGGQVAKGERWGFQLAFGTTHESRSWFLQVKERLRFLKHFCLSFFS